MVRAPFRPTDHPGPSSQGNGANLPLQMVSIQGHVGRGQNHCAGGFPLQGVPGGLGERMGREAHLGDHRLVEPGQEGLDKGLGIFPAIGQLRCALHSRLAAVGFLLLQAPDAIPGRGDQRGLSPVGGPKAAAGLTPAWGRHAAIPGLGKALGDDIPLRQQDAPDLPPRRPHHRRGPGGRDGNGAFVLVARERPAGARVQLAFSVPARFARRFVQRSPLARQNRRSQGLRAGRQQLRCALDPLRQRAPTQPHPRLD
jgi:hypothetical protein